ncbi:hypothetical protein [Pseudomonas asplenii]|uniref:hypothetical protein n=1 Tax=Pseudomonas asplenii TaxID=53407 RepID=UPI0012FB6CDC|nr:hypothetical protein [Pseudomonas fuscovaginae]
MPTQGIGCTPAPEPCSKTSHAAFHAWFPLAHFSTKNAPLALFELKKSLRWQKDFGTLYRLFSGGYPVVSRATGYDTLALWLFYCTFALCLPFVFLFWKDNRVDRWLGEFSYPLYIVHGFIIGLLLEKIGLPEGTYSTQAIIIGTSLLVCLVCLFRH